VSEHKGEIR